MEAAFALGSATVPLSAGRESTAPASDSIVVIGGGHAAAQLCSALAAAGQAGRVHLVCEEPELPYHRPPLSKAFLRDEGGSPLPQVHRPAPWYAESGIQVHTGVAAVAIDRAQRRVRLADGSVLAYGALVLATGARARRLPHLPLGLANVIDLRTVADARRLRDALHRCAAVTIVGGGFIGLEIAASARALGRQVRVLESAPRLLTRALSAAVAEHVLATHRGNAIDVQLGVAVGGFDAADGRLRALTVDGVRHEVELMVQGIGAVPEHQLASDAGLHCENGIVVDENMRSSDPHILAIGDCASFPEPGSARRLRLESVQNANDQAKVAAATLVGQPRPYAAVPWFWSEQGDLRLQMVGLVPAEAERHRRPGASAQSFSILHYVGERLVCVESVNAAHDHLAARKLLEGGRTVAPALACDPSIPLKQH